MVVMRKEIIMPKIGLDMEEGTVCNWVKKVGDKIDVDDVLLEIETDKATTEVKATVKGTLAEITVREGETVGVTEVIGWIDVDE
jgi:pyruvate/2-oxoglutarate dehydrogenase complex dihydrolipoamide acyltransferase (E2) component